MPVTAWRSPTATISSTSITNPDNVFSSDNAYAEANAVNDAAEWGTFGDFAIPSNATIVGIEMRIEGYYDAGTTNHDMNWAIHDGTSYRSKTMTMPSGSGSEAYTTIGGASDIWGGSWVVGDFADGTFKIRMNFSGVSVTHHVDNVQVRVYYSLPKIETLTDNFDDNSFNTSKWTRSSGTDVTESSGRLNIAFTSNEVYRSLESNDSFDLTASSLIVEAVDLPDMSDGSVRIALEEPGSSDSNLEGISFLCYGTNGIRGYARKAGGAGTNDTGIQTYNATNHRFLRIREASGTIYLDTADVLGNWTNFTSFSSTGYSIENLKFRVSVYSAAESDTAIIDNVNPQPVTKSHTTDALLNNPSTKTHTADTYKYVHGYVSHSSDVYTQQLIGVPVWVSPTDGASVNLSNEPLVFEMPVASANMHFHLQIDTVNTFDSGDLQEYKSFADQTNWEYWDGDSWEPWPIDGVPNTYSGNQARFTPNLTQDTYYRRIRGFIYLEP